MKGKTGSEGITQNIQNKKKENALALLNQLKLLMNLWSALTSALNTELKPSKTPAKSLQITMGWAVTVEVLDSLQLLLTATYQHPNFAVEISRNIRYLASGNCQT